MNTEAGSGLTVRAMLAGLRNQAKAAGSCVHVALVDDTHVTVHHFPEDSGLHCWCGAVAKPTLPSAIPAVWYG